MIWIVDVRPPQDAASVVFVASDPTSAGRRVFDAWMRVHREQAPLGDDPQHVSRRHVTASESDTSAFVLRLQPLAGNRAVSRLVEGAVNGDLIHQAGEAAGADLAARVRSRIGAGEPLSEVFSPDGTTLATTSNGEVRLWTVPYRLDHS